MRVRLSYTVEEEDVLKEAAKIINLAAEDVQQAIELFRGIQTELVGKDDEVPNVPKSLEMIDELRKALLAVDTRALEVAEIVTAYDDYQRQQRPGPVASDLIAPEIDGSGQGVE